MNDQDKSKTPPGEHPARQKPEPGQQPEHLGGITGGATAELPDDGHKVQLQDAGPEQDNNP